MGLSSGLFVKPMLDAQNVSGIWCALLGSGENSTGSIDLSWEWWHSSVLASLPEGLPQRSTERPEEAQEGEVGAKGEG